MSGTAQARYSTWAIALHWLIAILVIVNWRLAEAFEEAADADKLFWINQHKTLGITILLLSVLRLVWRMAHTPPALPDQMAGWEKLLARSIHTIFYIMLIGLPFGGWLASSYSGYPIRFWGLFDWPLLPVLENKDMGHKLAEAHGAGGEVLLILIALHIVGALKHQFIDKLPSFSRMWPGKG